MRRPSFLRRAPAPATGKEALQRHYRERLAEPVDERLAVFAAYWNRGYACNPAAIHRKALELVPGLRAVWVVKRDAAAAMPDDVDCVHPATPEYFDAIARAGFLVNNVNWPNNVVKRDGQVHVMTHHGTPLKKMGLSLQEAEGREKNDDFDAFMRRCARWDYSIAANPFSTRAWEAAYPGLSFASLETGYPRNDVLAAATPDAVARARTALGLEPGQVAVLYAPTHREYETDGSELLDLASLAPLLGDEHVVLARQHYLEDGGLEATGRVRDVSAHPSVEELCLAADVLVTDYSSIMFDYAVLDRPIVIFAPDWDTYRRKRGTYFDLMEQRPGPVACAPRQVADAIVAGDPDPAARAAFRAEFCALEDGGASERVVREVFGA
ncbi:MAG: CDP-glycerol:glycerophosphate glycerophosphotransferase [Solirubrobacterales bacterium]|nr:CDP-glycerol:glycerophosphate glycerophosphotransferase [Solirubrobacterales bacterium]